MAGSGSHLRIADPDKLLRSMCSCAATHRGFNPDHWCHPDLDELLREGRAALDRRECERYCRAAQALWHAEALAVPLAHSIQFTPVRKDVVGYTPSPLGKVQFHGVDLRVQTSIR